MNNLNQENIRTLEQRILSAGEIAFEAFKTKNYSIEEKYPGHPVTSVDLELNSILIAELHRLFPEDAILSEEVIDQDLKAKIKPNRIDNDRVWIIDPLDGTKDFIYGIENFSISVGLVIHNKPVYGFIYNPAKKFFIHGGEDFDIVLNNKKVFGKTTNALDTITDLKVLLSRSEMQNNLFPDLVSKMPDENIEPIGSIAYKLALLSAGEADLVLSRRPKSEWDIAGGAALLKKLDYELFDKDFKEISFNQPDVICSGIIAGSKPVIQLYRNFLLTSSDE